MGEKNFELAVVGGGIGGLALTAGLLHRGVPVHIYEAARAFAEIGAGVGFGPNSVAAMSKIAPGIFEGYRRQATENGDSGERATWFDFHTGTGELERIHKVIVPNSKIGASSVHRAHFLDELAALIPDENVSFGKRLARLEDLPSGRIRLCFSDETTAEVDAVIGCDGVKSIMRPIILGESTPASTPRYTNKYAYRGLVPMEKAAKALGNYYARNAQMYLGPDGHVLTFPIEHGKTMNVVAFRTGTGKWEDERWVLPTPKEDRLRDFQGWNSKVQDILNMMGFSDVWALFEHAPAKTYCKGPLVLLGDAAHASTPHQGAGAGQALEDAFILSSLLGSPSVKSPDDVVSAFVAYDSVRRPRSQKVVTTSREAGMLYDYEGAGVGADEGKIRETLKGMYNWIWSEDLDGQLKEAELVLVKKVAV